MSGDLTFDPSTVDLEVLLKRLHLANARRVWRELCERAETEQWSCRDFLAVLVAEEIAHRQQTRLRRAVHDAHFPFLKTIDDFNFSLQSTVRLQLLGSYLGPEFVTEGRNLILMGKTGRGKTHLAIAIAYRAIQNGATALFTTAAELIDDLSAASRDGRLRQTLAKYIHPHVLVVDEVGYLTYGPDAANVLFHVVNDRHLRRRPILFTTNKSPLAAWGAVLHDHDLAEAIVDRTLERGRLLVLDGPSVRTPHLDSQADPANSRPDRISGIDRTKFPEPAAYRHDREGRAAEVTVTYLMRALGRCRRSIQRYLRLLEREGYIRVDVVHGDRTRMCTGLVVQLLSPLFPRHHAEKWPAKLGIPGATQESQKKRFIDSRGARLVRIPVQSWALRCMDGVFRSLMKTLPPPDLQLVLAA
jgi:DNA replication protein DnaC